MTDQPTTSQMRALLLRRLPPEEVARLETAIFKEEGVAERLLEEEFDLLDDYSRGRLTPTDRADVERYLSVTPERIESLRVARALAARRSASPVDMAPPAVAVRKPHRGSRSVATWLAVAAGLAGGAVILHGGWHTNTTPIPTTPPAARNSVPTAPSSATESVSTTAAPTQTVMLFADAERGGAATSTVHISAANPTLRLQAEVSGPPLVSTWSIRVDDLSGHPVLEESHLAAREAGRYRFVEITVPVQVLGMGSRTVSLRRDDSPPTAPPQYRWQVNIDRAGAAR